MSRDSTAADEMKIPVWTEPKEFTIEQMKELSKTAASLRPITFERALKEMLSRYATAEAKLREMTKDRDLWQGEHNEDCPNLAELAQAREEVERLRKSKDYESALRVWSDELRLLTEERDSLKAQLREHQKPVTDEEIEAVIGPDTLPGDAAFRLACLEMADRLIRFRSNPVDGSKGDSKC